MTGYPLASSALPTRAHPLESAKAPWTSTTVGFGFGAGFPVLTAFVTVGSAAAAERAAPPNATRDTAKAAAARRLTPLGLRLMMISFRVMRGGHCSVVR